MNDPSHSVQPNRTFVHIGHDGAEQPCEVISDWPDIGCARCQMKVGEGWVKFFGVYDASKARAAGYEVKVMQPLRVVVSDPEAERASIDLENC